jgi:hypothetical protein
MAALEEPLLDEVLDMFVDGAHRTGTDPLRNLLERRASAFLSEELVDEMQDCLLALGKICRLHGIKVGERGDCVNPFFSLFFNILIFHS